MKFQKMLSVVFFLIAVSASNATPAQAQQMPSLVAEADHTVRDSRGDGAESFKIASAILKETRRIYVVLPVSYSKSASDRRYPVTIVLDGEANVPPVAAVSHELSRNGQIPESVIIAIPNNDPMRGRLHDLTPPGLSVSGSSRNEGGDRFLDFIEQELLPAVDRQFRTAAPRTFIGHSSGGILVTYAAATRSAYRAFISIDAPIHLGENWLAKKLTERAKASPTPLRYVSLEARFGWPDDTWKTLVAAAPASWKLHREQFKPKESHESIGMIGMYLGLREAFSDYSMLAAPVAPTTSILPYYAKVSASLNANVIPPRKLLLNVVEDLLMEGRGAAAREAYNSLASGYGAPSDSARLLAQIAEVERHPPPTETVEGLLSTPFPTPEEARDYIGEWIGDAWMNPEEPRTGRLTLRIKVVDGRVVGEVEDAPLPPPYRVRRIEYLRITPAGLTYGYMNGMRPRGVLLYEGKLEGDTLSGKMRFGGIDFKLPDGSSPPSPSFSFKRRISDQKPASNHFDEAAKLEKVSFSVPQRPRPGDNRKEIAIGATAPDWRLKTVDGETVALSELRGKVVVLDFWANWCGPCRKLEPLFDQLVSEYQDQPVKFFTLSIWPDQDFNPQAYLKEHKMASTFLIGDDAVASNYGIWGMPTYYVIGPAGKVSYVHVLLSVNAEALGKRLREAIEKALSTEQAAQPDPRLTEWAKLPPPTIEKMKPFLGVWESKRNSDNQMDSATTFEVSDGVIRARHRVTPAGVEPFQLEVQFIRVLDGQTLQWGLRNPSMGIILQTARLVDVNTLQGTSEPVGIPQAPPPHNFTLKRSAGDRKIAPNNLTDIDEAAAKVSQESERSRTRDEWQRPAEVFDALAVKPGSRVADIGCGHGYFTFRLASRVGVEGKVYAVDIDQTAIDKVRQRKEREKLAQVEPILGESADPRLPNDLDAVLIVDTYHEFHEYDQTMQAVFRALKPGGRLVIIDGEGPAGRPRTEYHRLHTIPPELVREEAARQGFVFKESRPGFYDAEYGKKMYFLIFERPLPNPSPKSPGQLNAAIY